MTDVQRLAATVTELRAQVQWLLARAEDPEEVVTPPRWCCWRELPRDKARALWRQLVEWVDWLIARYGIGDGIPACWYLHPALVEELTAIYAGWRSAYLAEEQNLAGWDPLTWHDALEKALHRIREWDRRGCRDGTHRPDLPPADGFDPAVARAAGPPRTDLPARPRVPAAG
jgi:hypothetical protein